MRIARVVCGAGLIGSVLAASGPVWAFRELKTVEAKHRDVSIVAERPGMDSFSLAVRAAAGALGVKADYDTILAMSTNGFAPDVRADETCRADWMTRGRGQCLDLVAARLGLKVRPVGGYEGRIDRCTREKAAGFVGSALAKGGVVITDSGWQWSFSQWGIVTAARRNGRIEGANAAMKENFLDHPCSFWVLTRSGTGIDPREADRTMFERAVARIRGDRTPFLPGFPSIGLPACGAPPTPGAVKWGLPAMDLWIAQMEKPVYQEDDPASSAGNARMCALYVGEGARSTAAYLKSRLAAYPEPVRSRIATVAGRYERIAALLDPFTVTETGRGYQAVIGDPAKRKDHVDRVLRPVRAELVAAVPDLEGTMEAMDRAPGESAR